MSRPPAGLPRPARLGLLVAAAVAACAAGLALLASPAGAHASLVGTSPAPGQRLDRPPAEIVLELSERVRPLHGGSRLMDERGQLVAELQPVNASDDGGRVRLPVPADLRDGTYTVSWRVVSADSHPVNGAFTFTVGAGGAGAAPPDGEDLAGTDVAGPVVAALWLDRLLGYASLSLLLGGGLFLAWCWPAGLASTRARRIVWTGWGGVLAAAVLGLLLQGPYEAGRSLDRIGDPELLAEAVRTDYGMWVTIRIAVLALLGLLLARVLRRRPATAELVLLGALAAALPATWFGTGHANAGPVVQRLADTAHLIAMSAWLGGLVLLVACVLPAKRDDGPQPEAVVAVTRFSRLAMLAVAILVTTGLLQAWLELGGLAALTGSSYGRLLFTKLAAVGIVLWLGAMSRAVVQRRWLRPASGDQQAKPSARTRRARRERDRTAVSQLRRSVLLEVVIVGAVLAVTAVLVATPPGTHRHATAASLAAQQAAGPVVRELELSRGGRVQVRVEPARPGPNQVSVKVLDGSGAARDVPEVTASLRLATPELGPFDVTFERLGPGDFRAASATMPVGGDWQLEVAVRTSDFDLSKAITALPIG